MPHLKAAALAPGEGRSRVPAQRQQQLVDHPAARDREGRRENAAATGRTREQPGRAGEGRRGGNGQRRGHSDGNGRRERPGVGAQRRKRLAAAAKGGGTAGGGGCARASTPEEAARAA